MSSGSARDRRLRSLQRRAARVAGGAERARRRALGPGGRGREERGHQRPLVARRRGRGRARRASRRRLRGTPLRERWLDRLLGPEREDVPSAFHVAWMRRLSPLADTYTKERSVPVCAASLHAIGFAIEDDSRIRLDLDDRPQKSPRACVIPSDPPSVVHLITRAMGGLHDYSAFLHEAGHALHYAGSDPALPYTFRALSRDHALTEIFSYIVEAISREPGWHAEHFGLSDDVAAANAEAASFVEAVLFRRYAAKLRFELMFWDRFADDGGTPDGYSELLTRCDRDPLPGRELPLRHGRRLLLGRLSPRLDPVGAAPTPSPQRRSATTGGGHRPRESSCASSSARGPARRARRSPAGWASSRSTPHRSRPSSPTRSAGRRACSGLPCPRRAACGSRASAPRSARSAPCPAG